METPLGAAGARARNSVDSSEWQALCDLEAELEAFQKWLMLGDDRNTAQVYVHGRRVWPAPE